MFIAIFRHVDNLRVAIHNEIYIFSQRNVKDDKVPVIINDSFR